ncbi:hypothetical protein B0T25DRAFT_161568 [Lasiosphaeria hispida]|uniref:Uncharacterized protein n=1 Tax=Lasiosphaeria hispida TaxID=260671 RepID=A0AAJ0MGI9_9PEZI|nr:hypothetical protein B0T25DRAFT_161568 [Lasiosphaeria hispida]
MGLQDAWKDHGATRFPQQQGHPSGNGGEGDSGGSPRPQPSGRSWPTLVIGAGDSSSLEELRRDMRWWFSASNHEVKIIHLAKLDLAGRRTILEKWVETTPPPHSGPTARAASMRTPNCVQEITIDWTENTPVEIPTSYIVTTDDLRLKFSLLFLRPPENPREHDILITVPRLQVWASMVWETVVELQA